MHCEGGRGKKGEIKQAAEEKRKFQIITQNVRGSCWWWWVGGGEGFTGLSLGAEVKRGTFSF